jgi:F420 biosynthesis protein FbiB-like protein
MIYELMKLRRSVRRFKPECPPREAIERLIAAAITAPSASNQQPWRFVVVTDRAAVAKLASAVREAVDRISAHIPARYEEAFRAYGDYFTRFEHAPVVIVPLCRPITILSNLVDGEIGPEDREAIAAMERDSGLIGTSLAIENLLLMAHEQGLGASGMTGPLVAAGRIREILEVPSSWQVVALIPVGYPAEEPPPTARRPAGKVVRWVGES